MNAGQFNMLHHSGDMGFTAVAEQIDLRFNGILQKLLHKKGMLLVKGPCGQIVIPHGIVHNQFNGLGRFPHSRAQDQRVSHLGRQMFQIGLFGDQGRCGLQNTHAVHVLPECGSVLDQLHGI